MKRVWYAIRNILMAVIVAAVGSATVAANELNSIIVMLVGICLILGGLNSFQKTSLWISILFVALGVGVISVGETVLKDNNLSYYISVGLLAVLAFFQYKKIFDGYGRKRWQVNLLKALAVFYPTCIIVGAVFSVILQNKTGGVAFFEMGALVWIVHTILVLKFQSGTAGSMRGNNRKTSSSGTGQSKVADKMRSLASYLTGGFDDIGYGASVKYSIAVNVTDGHIKFTVSGKISGTENITSEAQFNSAKATLEKVAQRRLTLVLNEAEKELQKLGTDCNYTIEAVGGDFS